MVEFTLNAEQLWLQEQVSNAMLLRQDIIKAMMNPKRDIAMECGHPRDIKTSDYFDMHERNDIAARVNDIWPEECWKRSPVLYENVDPATETEFEKQYAEVLSILGSGSAFVDDKQEGNPIWDALFEADTESGKGHFSVVLMGLDDKKDLDAPVETFDLAGHSKKKLNLTFLRVLDESKVEIGEVEKETSSARFGLPVSYKMKLTEDSDTETEVHWHRVHHVTDSGKIISQPRMKCVYNRLLDLTKLLGGSAEMYWRGAFPGMTFETHPDAGGDVEINKEEVKGQIRGYMERLQRAMLLVGLTAKSHAPQVVDPKPQVEVQLDAICIRIKVPKRIFMGSERGELSSNQDATSFSTSVEGRRRNIVTPKNIVPFMNRLIHLGVLVLPKLYKVDWPSLNVLTDEQEANIAVKRTQAMQLYVTGGLRALISPLDWGTGILRIPQEQAKQMFANADTELKKFEQRLVTALRPAKTGGGAGQTKDITKRGRGAKKNP